MYKLSFIMQLFNHQVCSLIPCALLNHFCLILYGNETLMPHRRARVRAHFLKHLHSALHSAQPFPYPMRRKLAVQLHSCLHLTRPWIAARRPAGCKWQGEISVFCALLATLHTMEIFQRVSNRSKNSGSCYCFFPPFSVFICNL